VLAEGGVRRLVPPGPLLASLTRILGPPSSGDGEGATPGASAPPRVVDGPLELVTAVPEGSAFAVSPPLDHAAILGRTVHQLLRPTAPPPTALSILDQLRVARARGATHLVVRDASPPWLARRPDLAEFLGRHGRIVACSAVGAVWELSPPPAAGGAKVLCIGLTKTGTSSLHAALGQVGLRSLHWGDVDAHPIEGTAGVAAASSVRDALRDDQRLLAYLGEQQYDAYSDIGELSARFELADLQYPGSRFILTVRDLDDWVDSRRRHVERNQDRLARGIYGGVNLTVDEGAWQSEYVGFVQRVMDHFVGRDDLLVLDVCGGDGWARLAPFLDVAAPPGPFPSENVQDRELDRAQPYLARRSATTTAALEAVLGRRVAVARGLIDELELAPWPDVIAVDGGVLGLASLAPSRSRLVLAGSPTDHPRFPRRRVRHLAEGPGAASAVAQLHAAGATHLIVLADAVEWLPAQPELAEHLRDHAHVVACNDAGVLWRLSAGRRQRPQRHRPGPSAQS
jgi:hypothetical protein